MIKDYILFFHPYEKNQLFLQPYTLYFFNSPRVQFFYTLPPLLFIYMSENMSICAFVFICVCLKMTTPIGRKQSTKN